jgi:hypothetical protein
VPLSQSQTVVASFVKLLCACALAAAVAAAFAPAALAGSAQAKAPADDTDPPTLVSSDPAGGAALAAPPASIVLHFSEEVATTPLPTAANSIVGGPFTVSVQGSDVIVTPLGRFVPHADAGVTVSGVTDLAGNQAPPVTVAFTVDRVPAVIGLMLSRTTVTAGKMTELSGLVGQPSAFATSGSLPVAGLQVMLERRYAGEAGFSALTPTTTDATGHVMRRLSPKANATYRVTTAETADLLATSAEIAVSVRPKLVFETQPAIWKGQKIVFRGSVSPSHPGATVTIQHKVGDEWQSFRDVTLNSKSHFSSRWEPPKVATYRFRLTMAADAQHLEKTTAGRATKVAPPNPHGISPAYKHFIVVDLSECHLYYYESGVVIRKFDCVVGKPSTPTPIGQWPVYQKVVGMWGPYGPFTMWYHSPYHFGIHGTNEPWLLSRFPRHFSHGCTRLANKNITWLFPKVPVGTPVRNIP